VIVATLAILGPSVAAALIAVLGVLGSRGPRHGPVSLALAGAVVSAVAAVVALARAARGIRDAATLPAPLGLPGFPPRLVADPLAAVLQVTVAVVALLVFVYAVGYMGRDPGQARFYAAMSFFVAAMQALVLAGDWVLFLAAYELIGLASYLLIGFWYARPGVSEAATRAFLTTRAADLGLYLGVFALVTRSGTTAIAATPRAGAAATVTGLLLLVAAMGVSALLHAATLVVAGPILLARALPLLPPGVLLTVGAVGGVTALVAGLMALAQDDLKRLLAASTSSQLGFMFLALGAGSPGGAIAHLVAHAAMKGALFLGAGVYQEAYGSTRFDDLAGAGRAHRVTFALIAVAGLALAGIPPLAGFWSKDAVVAATVAAPTAGLLAPLAVVGTLLTGGYVGRALRLLWRGDAAEGPVAGLGWMIAGLAALALLAATLGVAVRPIGALLHVPILADPASLVVDLAAAVTGLLIGWLFPLARLFGPARTWVATGFRVRGGFDGLVARPALALAVLADGSDRAIHRAVRGTGRSCLGLARAARVVDERGIDGMIHALVSRTRDLGARARLLQTGLVSRELVFTMGGVVLIAAVVLVVR